MKDTIFNHRSIRQYKNTPIDEGLLTNILEAGTRASTIGTMQIYSMVVTQDEQIKNQLWEASFKQDMVRQAPVFVTFCADVNRFHNWCNNRKAEPGYDNFLWYINGAIDAILASQNVTLAAEDNGLGVCYIGTIPYMADRIIEILNLPKLVVPVTSIVMGYPNESPGLTDRLPLEAVVHQDTYKDFSKEDIDRLYAEKEALPLSQELLEINKKETLAQVFTDNRYKKEDNITFSKKYLETIKKQGFQLPE